MWKHTHTYTRQAEIMCESFSACAVIVLNKRRNASKTVASRRSPRHKVLMLRDLEIGINLSVFACLGLWNIKIFLCLAHWSISLKMILKYKSIGSTFTFYWWIVRKSAMHNDLTPTWIGPTDVTCHEPMNERGLPTWHWIWNVGIGRGVSLREVTALDLQS